MIETYRSSLAMFFGDKRYKINMEDIKRARYVSTFEHVIASMSLKSLVVLDQQHTAQGLCVDDTILSGQHSLYKYVGDYLITNLKQCGLVVLTADCLPIILYDSLQQVAGIIHAGWRGSAAGIVLAALQHMQERYQTIVTNVQVFYGANAQTCCYEVGSEFPAYFNLYDYAQKAFIKRDNALYFDNKLFITLQLQKLGIKPENIYNKHTMCTICHQGYCSARREKKLAERQITVVALI